MGLKKYIGKIQEIIFFLTLIDINLALTGFYANRNIDQITYLIN